MEGQVITAANSGRRFSLFGLTFGLVGVIGLGHVQEQPLARASGRETEMSLRKSVVTREFHGRQFTGEERQIAPGDSLWRILVEEKGLPERRFHSYLVVIRGVNPQIKSLDVLRVGDRIFIPLRLDAPDQAPKNSPATAEGGQRVLGKTFNYRVKAGEHLYRILREQLKVSDEVKLAEYYALMKDLNSDRSNWDNLVEGEVIRLPVIEGNLTIAEAELATRKPEVRTAKPPVDSARSDRLANPTPPAARVPVTPEPLIAPLAMPHMGQTVRLPARDNMRLFAKVIEVLGNELQQSGEEVVTLPDGTVRFDKRSYPVVYNAALRQKVVLDPDGKIPGSLKAKLSDPSIGAPVLSLANRLSMEDAVRQLLVGLGYQPLPTEKPIVVQEGGVVFEAKGNWMALAPEISNRTQEAWVVNLTDSPTEVPGYLKTALAKHGLHLREVVWPPPAEEPIKTAARNDFEYEPASVRDLPAEKRNIVDALLLSFGVALGVAEPISIELGDGLRVDKRVDRVFELDGRRTVLFFSQLDPAIREALQDRRGIQTLELDIDSLSSREVIGRILSLVADRVVYGEHRFLAASGSLILKAWGFHVPSKAMFVTDRQIPPALHRFFFEKGLHIVYFR